MRKPQTIADVRRPPRPWELVGALQDTVHEESGQVRSRRAARSQKKT